LLHENKHINFFLKLGYFLLISLTVCLLAKYAIRAGWPFLTAILFSSIITKPVNFIARKTGLPRGPLAALFTVGILIAGAVLVYLLASVVIYNAKDIVSTLPQIADEIMAKVYLFEDTVDVLLHDMIPFLKDTPFISVEAIMKSMSSGPSIDYVGIFSTAASAAFSLPSIIFTAVFIFMGTYFFTVQRDDIRDFISHALSPTILEAADKLREFLFSSVFKWLKAQLILICITCVELFISFSILDIAYTLPLSACIAIVDALPILGTGTVLIPWSIFCLITGSFKKSIGLILTYIIVLSVRNTLEPRVVGQKIGLNPMVTLLSMYIGFRLGGFFGLAFVPICVLSIIRLQELGYIELWAHKELNKNDDK